MNRIITLITLVALTAMSASAFAKGPRGEKWDKMSESERLEKMEDRLDKKIEHMTKELSLTSQQQAKVRLILADTQTQMLQLREKHQGDREAFRADAKKIREGSKTQLKTVLNKEQQTKLAELKKQHKGKRGKHGKHGKRGKRGEKMGQKLAKKLDLNDAQQAKVKTIMASQRSEIQAVKESDLDKEAKRAKVKTIIEGSMNDIEKVLNAEQKVKFKELRAKRQERRGKKQKK